MRNNVLHKTISFLLYTTHKDVLVASRDSILSGGYTNKTESRANTCLIWLAMPTSKTLDKHMANTCGVA